MKTFSLLKATLTEDMNVFKYRTKENSSKFKKMLLPLVLTIIVCSYMAFYAYSFAKELYQYNLTYIMLTFFLTAITLLTFMEAIYKSQGILFDSKDNDLLFSLPIKRSTILFIRTLKLILFQYMYNALFVIPALGVYVYFEHPGIGFYLISIIMFLILPFIPTVIGSVLGYGVKLISSKFKSKKIMQTILSFAIFFGIYYVSMNSSSFFKDIVGKSTSINDIITNIYYPIGTYISLINKFDFVTFIKFLLINIIPFIIFVMLGQRYYFRIISNSKNVSTIKRNNRKESIKVNKPIVSLARKELKRYFSSPVYMFNTAFGLIFLLVGTIILCVKGANALDSVIEEMGMPHNLSINVLFYILLLFAGLMTSITSSSISLEGKTINITKSLPVSARTILNSKILYCYIIELPFMIVSIILFSMFFKPSILFILIVTLVSFVTIGLSACIGLIVNLKYPKLSFHNDTEVVKQSMSSLISVLIALGLVFTSIGLIIYLSDYLAIDLLLLLHLILFTIICAGLYMFLMKWGFKAYRKLSV